MCKYVQKAMVYVRSKVEEYEIGICGESSVPITRYFGYLPATSLLRNFFTFLEPLHYFIFTLVKITTTYRV